MLRLPHISSSNLEAIQRFPFRWSSIIPITGDMVDNCNCNCTDIILDNCGKIPLLVTPDDLKAEYIDNNVDDKSIAALILYAQDILLLKLGICFMNKLYDYLVNGTALTFDVCNLINVYFKPAIAYKVLSELSISDTYKLRNIGMVLIAGEHMHKATNEAIDKMRQYYEYKFEFYFKRLVKQLRCINQICLCHINLQTNIVL